jgi:hypothetical protein
VRSKYVHAVKQELKSVKGDADAEQLEEVLHKAALLTIPEEEKIKKKWISRWTMELVKEKWMLKCQRNDSEQAEKQYEDKCSDMRRASMEDKRKWLDDQCARIERHYMGSIRPGRYSRRLGI